MRTRVDWIEDLVLPAGFSSNLRATISTDAFVEYANENVDRLLERFIEGIADTGRRGTKEALRVLFHLVGDDEANPVDLVDVCFRLAVAADSLTVPNLDKDATMKWLQDLEPATFSLAHALKPLL